MNEIIVKTQKQYNDIPDDFSGTIYIEGGTKAQPLTINRNFKNAVQRIRGSAVIKSVCGSAVIESVSDSAVIEYVSDSAVIEYVSDSAVIKSVYGSAVIKSVYDSAVIEYVSDSAVIKSVSDSAVIEYVSDSAVIKSVYGSAVIKSVYDSAVIEYVSDSAVIQSVSGFASILWVQGRAKVTTYGHNIVRYRRNEQSITVVASPNTVVVVIEEDVDQPQTLDAYKSLYPIQIDENGMATQYKAVHKDEDGIYRSDYDRSFTYEIGRVYTEKAALSSAGSCAPGLHVAPLYWARNYARNWDDAAILEVRFHIDNVVVSPDTDGKIRVSELAVVRELSEDEL